MKSFAPSKAALSPFVAVAFLVLSATGILLFFHLPSGPVKVLHEWFGWLFVIGGTLHVLLNGRPLLAYLRQRVGLISVGCALVFVVALFAAGSHGPNDGPHGHHGSAVNAPSE